MSNTATMVIEDLKGFNGNASLYRLSNPVKYEDGLYTEYVVVSAVCHWAYETYIFPADSNGDVLDWGELDGSQRGVYDHDRVLNNAGYKIV